MTTPVPLSDAEINQMATEEWLGVLSRLWIAVGKQIDAERLKVYRDLLGDIPMGILEVAVKNSLEDQFDYSTVPLPGKVMQEARKEMLRCGVYSYDDWADKRAGKEFGEWAQARKG